jgi:hypothetical protein
MLVEDNGDWVPSSGDCILSRMLEVEVEVEAADRAPNTLAVGAGTGPVAAAAAAAAVHEEAVVQGHSVERSNHLMVRRQNHRDSSSPFPTPFRPKIRVIDVTIDI